MTAKEAWHLLRAISGSVEDKKREKIGNVKLLDIVLRDAELRGCISYKDYNSILFFYEEERKKLQNNKYDVKDNVAILLVFGFLIGMGLIYSILNLIFNNINDNVGTFGMYFFYLVLSSLFIFIFIKIGNKFTKSTKKVANEFYRGELARLKIRIDSFPKPTKPTNC